MIPTLVQACAMNALAYEDQGESPVTGEWERRALTACSDSGCIVVPWHHCDGSVYLAIRGSNSRRDTLDDIKVFFGQPPLARIAFLERYIQTHHRQALDDGQLMVGGHSLGGLVAMGVAARWRLPGVVQNSPGWLINAPAPEALARMVEVRTGRDVVGVWGHSVPTTVTVHDPEAGKWDWKKLHNVDRQMRLVEQHGLAHMRLDDPALRLQPKPRPAFKSVPSTVDWMLATWTRVNEDHAQVALPGKRRKPGI